MVSATGISRDIEDLQRIKADLYALKSDVSPFAALKIDGLAKSLDNAANFLYKNKGALE